MIDSLDGQQFAAPEVAYGEAARGWIAAGNLLIMALRQTDDQQFIVKLIRPEPGNPVMDRWPFENVERCGFCLLEGVVDRFQPDSQVESQRRVIGTIAGCIDCRIAGAAILIDDDAVLAGEARIAGKLHVGDCTDADNEQIRFISAPVGADDTFDPATPLQPDDARVADYFHALGTVFVCEILRHVRCDDAVHHPVRHLQNGDRAAQVTGGGGGFETDVAAADDDSARAWLEARLNHQHVRHAAQIVHSGQVGPGTRQLAGPGAETQEQAVVDDFLAARQNDTAGGRIQAGGSDTQLEFDMVLVVKRLMSKRQTVCRQLTGQELLGQRRPLIRQVRLVAHQYEATLETFAPQGVDGLRTGVATAYDEDRADDAASLGSGSAS